MNDFPKEIVEFILCKMDVKQRSSCAQVSTAWKAAAAAATAATRDDIVLHNVYDATSLQQWLEEHGGHVDVLQLHAADHRGLPTALPCPQLQHLYLHASSFCPFNLPVHNRIWEGISRATQLKTVSLFNLQTAGLPQEVMAVLEALPNLQHLAWRTVKHRSAWHNPAVTSIQGLTKLTGLELKPVTADALEQLSAFTKLRQLSLDDVPYTWGAAGCPGLQQLTALTSLHLGKDLDGYNVIPLVIVRLTAVQHLSVPQASYLHVWELHALVGLTSLCVADVVAWDYPLSPLQLTALQRLKLGVNLRSEHTNLQMSCLSECTRLQELSLAGLVLKNFWGDPECVLGLTALQHSIYTPGLKAADVKRLVACCSSLRNLQLGVEFNVSLSALSGLSHLTHLTVDHLHEAYTSSVAQLTGLRQLLVGYGWRPTPKDLL